MIRSQSGKGQMQRSTGRNKLGVCIYTYSTKRNRKQCGLSTLKEEEEGGR